MSIRKQLACGLAIVFACFAASARAADCPKPAMADAGFAPRYLCVCPPYCKKPLPCLPCAPQCFECDDYCKKPLPCLSCSPFCFQCDDYCRKPLPACLPPPLCQ